MYLRSLELQGFKSFPDKIKLEFNKGISAVVGPNGSGKSNIGDAMRWVMGEQSSKTLRGGKMEDVIFHGTKDRPAAGFAQVTLNIDNADRALSMDTDLVAVSRKLYRNGDSEYMINSKNVRLKDVLELFMDTGLGRDGYSIIGQGRIADIVSSKSTERREIFEEAAGISKFRYKKEEAERKLKAAEDNIARLGDILSELESRIGPLEKQCEKAKKFNELYSRKSKLEIDVWVTQMHQIERTLAENKEKAQLLAQQYEQTAADADKLENEVELCREQSSERSVKIDELKAEIHQIELKNSQADAEVAVIENDIKHLNEQISTIRFQIDESEGSKYLLEAELNDKREELSRLGETQKKLEQDIDKTELSFTELKDRSDDFDKSISESNFALSALYIKKSELAYKLESAKNSFSDVQESLASTVEDGRDIEGRCELADKELKSLTAQRDKTSESESELKNRLAGLNKLLENKKNKLSSAESLYDENNAKLQQAEQRLKVLLDLENSMEGFGFPVKHILTATRQGRISGVHGTVTQLIKVEQDYTVAIETALGGAMQYMVVEDEDTAKRGIRLLKEARAGRATFLPMTTVKGSRLKSPPAGEEGFVAVASELVSCDSKYSGIIDDLLGRICIAEDLDSANDIARRHHFDFKIVTLDGQVINRGGSFTGGSATKNSGILSRRNEIEKLEITKNRLSEEFKKLKDDRERLVQETAKYAADIDGSKDQLSELSKQLMKLDMDIDRVKNYAKECREKQSALNAEAERLSMRVTLLSKEIDELNGLVSENDRLIVEGEADMQTSQNELDEMKVRREELSEKLSALRMEQIELLKDIETCNAAIVRINDSITNSSSDKSKLLDQIEEKKAGIEEKKRDIEKVRSDAASSVKVIDGLKKEISTAQREHLELSDKAVLLHQEEKARLDEKEKLSNEMNRLEERIRSSASEYDKLAEKLWSDHELTVSEAEKDCEPVENMPQANKELAELRAKINALGNVNLGAIDEYAEVSERYEFLKAQLGDVTKSKSELETMIAELTETMKEMFITTFDKINKNFKQVFTELFGGGHGELELSDPDDVLECGIEIKVEPPGKIVKNLMSLSGGEQAFVAVCIYFSILKISPSPFCLLDEIEAALDESNVVKYAQYLHRFTDTTQFITITHRRGTMEEADVLYGVTMQDKGISKLLKMNPGDTIDLGSPKEEE
ncbi:MAG: chromosome segregation protein SMC [Ruminococcus sp.]|nr:chromosome segregation protein SMC [Ruminococcus sp.]